MADYYLQMSEVLYCTFEEFNELDAIVDWCSGEAGDPERIELGEELKALAVGACDESGHTLGEGIPVQGMATWAKDLSEGPAAWLQADDDFDVEFYVALVQRLMIRWDWEEHRYCHWHWANTCSKPRLGAFSGGEVMFNRNAVQWSSHLLPEDLPGVPKEDNT